MSETTDFEASKDIYKHLPPPQRNKQQAVEVYYWPEFIALMDRLGMMWEAQTTTKITLDFDEDEMDEDEMVRVAHGDIGSDLSLEIQAIEVYHWPEFIALMDRLGITYAAQTTKLTIILDVDDVVRVTHDYIGSDLKPEWLLDLKRNSQS